MFGWIAVVGVGVFVVALAAAGISEGLGFRDATDLPLGVTMLAGLALVLVFWPLWGTWSVILDKEPPGVIRPTAKLTLALVAVLVVGVLLLVAGVATGMLVEDDAPEWLATAALVSAVVGAAIVGAAVLAAAIAGGVVLGGAAWWWVGVVFAAGMIGVAIGIAGAAWPLAIGSVVALLVGGWGYRAARRAGLRQRRPDAIEAEQDRRASMR